MAVVRIGVVRMGVCHGFMTVAMRVRSGNQASVVVQVMNIVRVRMLVLQRFMLMAMYMMLGQMQPDANGHQRRGNPKQCRC